MASAGLADIWYRIYGDFFMASRLDNYRTLLRQVLDHGYQICSVGLFWNCLKNMKLSLDAKYFILRHDVDTDIATARAMLEIEQALGVSSSYFFRLSTIDFGLMGEIQSSKGEASYHYEELATVSKQKCLRTREDILREMPYIRQVFKKNLNRLRRESGLPMTVVASHGDFINRKVKAYNWEILEDKTLRSEVNIELEVYDESFSRHVSSRHSDTLYPTFWKPSDPLRFVHIGSPVICVLVHPRHWRANPKENLFDDAKRSLEGLRFSIGW